MWQVALQSWITREINCKKKKKSLQKTDNFLVKKKLLFNGSFLLLCHCIIFSKEFFLLLLEVDTEWLFDKNTFYFQQSFLKIQQNYEIYDM